ncbi:hypothetical protein CTEN210_16534 [Chaetoceros tenuissimus]|uniref:RING-type E3 ubiquitin transferase n=1 Tax=Chaetoceros tenuissimus TaxID=426638 RepID=A0AAD3D961_9STRA|nr:hypothetical protein CTEN210_16534 [Chaetoceros tenuissimus]
MEETGSSTVAPTLLGLGKDDRYQSRLSSLISEVIAPYLNVSNNTSNGTSRSNIAATHEIGVHDQQPEDILKPEINLLSRIVFGIIMAREGKSLGLEYVGLQYKKRTSIKFRLFILMYILCPYALDRIKRKGFDELKNAKISFLPSFFEKNETIRDRDDLRGPDRRRLFEESRRRMLERAQTLQTSNQNDLNGSSTVEKNQNSKLKRKTASSKLGSIKKRVLEILEQMAIAYDLQPPRPHHVPTQNFGEDGNQNSQNHQLTNTKLKRLGSMFKWLIHLNLALFYVNGKYPSILHRVLGLRIDGRNDKTKLKAELADYSPIGLMIIIQTLGKLTQALTEIIVKSYYQSLHSKLTDKNNERNQLIQKKVPSHVDEMQSISTVDGDICGICMTERNHPAASVKCGHVLCWDCLHHWIATVRQECPICRTSCTHQQVIALNNYNS